MPRQQAQNKLPNLISFLQAPFVKNRFIKKRCKLLFYIIEISEIPKTGSCRVTIDIANAFDSMRQKYGYGNDFIKGTELLYGRLKSGVINAVITTSNIKLKTDVL